MVDPLGKLHENRLVAHSYQLSHLECYLDPLQLNLVCKSDDMNTHKFPMIPLKKIA